jgi:hypothetical protein
VRDLSFFLPPLSTSHHLPKKGGEFFLIEKEEDKRRERILRRDYYKMMIRNRKFSILDAVSHPFKTIAAKRKQKGGAGGKN